MQNDIITTANCWSTASFGGTENTSSMELLVLKAHFDVCKVSRRRLFALQCFAQTMHGFVAARFVTTLVVVVALAIGVGSLGL